MRRLILAAAVLIPGAAYAQAPAPKVITIALPEASWQIVLNGLGELPMKTALPIFQDIQAQALPQLKQPEIEPKKDKK